MAEAVLLRLDEETYKKLDSGVVMGDDGLPVTGDPIVDQWEREAARGIKRS